MITDAQVTVNFVCLSNKSDSLTYIQSASGISNVILIKENAFNAILVWNGCVECAIKSRRGGNMNMWIRKIYWQGLTCEK